MNKFGNAIFTAVLTTGISNVNAIETSGLSGEGHKMPEIVEETQDEVHRMLNEVGMNPAIFGGCDTQFNSYENDYVLMIQLLEKGIRDISIENLQLISVKLKKFALLKDSERITIPMLTDRVKKFQKQLPKVSVQEVDGGKRGTEKMILARIMNIYLEYDEKSKNWIEKDDALVGNISQGKFPDQFPFCFKPYN